MKDRPIRPIRYTRQQRPHVALLIGSIIASLLVLATVQYYAVDGIEFVGTRASTAVAAPWTSATGNAQSERAATVRAAMQHAWNGYEHYAWGADELRPKSMVGKFGVMGSFGGFSGMGASVVDAMSTLHLMGLEPEFERARAWVAANMTIVPPVEQKISFFETTIRLVGGLLAAHDLSGHTMFLDKAHDLAQRLLPVFDGFATGILTNDAYLPWSKVKKTSQSVLLSELGSNLIELGTLSSRTGNATFRMKAEGGLRFLHAKHANKASYALLPLLGVSISRATGELMDTTQTVGAPADSYFEYLLKYWILKGKKDDHWRDRWVNATDAALKYLLVRPAGRTFTFMGELLEPPDEDTDISDTDRIAPEPTLSHLSCFFPGSVALGVISGAVTGDKADQYLEVAKSMMEGCFQLYNITTTGLSVDQATFDVESGEIIPVYRIYLQRPEVVESLFYLWRATHDEKYREWGWRIMQSIEKHCRYEAGYSGLQDAMSYEEVPTSDDTQQSWFLAETLKYLFLLFSDDSALDLDQWVFNTEAHPMKADAIDETEQWIEWRWLFGEKKSEPSSAWGHIAAAAEARRQ